MKIGVFDSGLGGLTVLKELLFKIPDFEFIYFGDTARTPYGIKSAETVRQYAIEITNFLLKRGAKIIVVACHTVSATSISILKEKFLNLPFFDVVLPSVKIALSSTKNKRIGLLATRTTVESKIYPNLFKKIDPEIKVFSNPAPLLVPLIEEGYLKGKEIEQFLEKYLKPLKLKKIDTLIIGCTHYSLIEKLIQKKIGIKKIVNPSKAVAIEVKKFLEKEKKFNCSRKKRFSLKVYLSDLTPQFEKIARKFLGKKFIVEKVDLQKESQC